MASSSSLSSSVITITPRTTTTATVPSSSSSSSSSSTSRSSSKSRGGSSSRGGRGRRGGATSHHHHHNSSSIPPPSPSPSPSQTQPPPTNHNNNDNNKRRQRRPEHGSGKGNGITYRRGDGLGRKGKRSFPWDETLLDYVRYPAEYGPQTITIDTLPVPTNHMHVPMMDEKQMAEWYDQGTMTILDCHPKAWYHWLVLPFYPVHRNLNHIRDLTVAHLPLLQRMQHRAYQVIHSHGLDHACFQIGFHAIPSMKLLHLHVISHDFATIGKTKHWHTMNTPELFIPIRDIIQHLQGQQQQQQQQQALAVAPSTITSTKLSMTLVDAKQAKALWERPEMTCGRCSVRPVIFTDVHRLKEHLQRVHFPQGKTWCRHRHTSSAAAAASSATPSPATTLLTPTSTPPTSTPTPATIMLTTTTTAQSSSASTSAISLVH